jgi:ATP-dependent DNA helicase RecG
MSKVEPGVLSAIEGLVAELLRKPPCQIEGRDFDAKGWGKSERELWKLVVDAAVCFANADGGIIFVGPSDRLTIDLTPACPHPGVDQAWLANQIRKWTHPPVECTVYRLADLMDPLPGMSSSILVVHVPKKKILFRHVTHAGVCLVRHGDSCEIDYHAYGDDYSSSRLPGATIADLSPNSLSWAFKYKPIQSQRHSRWRANPRSNEDYLTDLNLLAEESVGSKKLTLSSLLLFGRAEALQTFSDGTFVRITLIDPHDRTARPYVVDCRQNIIDTLRDIWTHQGTIWATLGVATPERPLQELMVNAFIHRDYRLPGEVNVRLKAGQSFEIQNPGGFLGNLGPCNLINASPVHRNRLLSEACSLLGFCEKSGSGIDIVYQECVASGFDLPYFQGDSSYFGAILPLGRNAGFAHFVQQRAKDFQALESLLVIRFLYNSTCADTDALAKVIQRPSEPTRALINDLCRRRILEEIREGEVCLRTFIREEIETAENPNQGRLFRLGQ